MPLVVSSNRAPIGERRPVASTPGVVSATASVGDVPVMLLSATTIVGTARTARLAANGTVSVQIPAVIVPTAVVTLPVPILGSASRAASTLSRSVVFVALHVIAAVVKPSYENLNVPPVGVRPNVMVCTSLVPADGAPAEVSPRYVPSMTRPPEMTGMSALLDAGDGAEGRGAVDRERQARLGKNGDLVLDKVGAVLGRERDHDALAPKH